MLKIYGTRLHARTLGPDLGVQHRSSDRIRPELQHGNETLSDHGQIRDRCGNGYANPVRDSGWQQNSGRSSGSGSGSAVVSLNFAVG